VAKQDLHWRDVSAVFLPEAPVTDPRGLIARRDEIRQLLEATSRDNAIPVVAGPPGIGKTSVLNVARSILIGFTEGLADLQLQFYEPEAVPRLVLWVRCDREMANSDDLARKVLLYLHTATELVPAQSTYRIREFSVEGTLPLASLKAAWERRPNDAPSASDELSAWLSRFSLDANAEVIIMLDECEHLTWLPELFAFVRRFEEMGTRFVLALRDYAVYRLRSGPYGDYRWLDEISLDRLTSTEIDEFFSRAIRRLSDLGVNLLIDPVVISSVESRSAGEPWYLQMIGAELLSQQAAKLGSAFPAAGSPILFSVRHSDFEIAEVQLVERRLRGVYGQMYSAVVQGAPRREEVLQALAAFPETIIPDGFVTFIGQKRIKAVRRIIDALSGWSPLPILIRSAAPVPGLEFQSHEFRVYCRVGRVVDIGSRVMAGQLVDSWRDQWV
jgi:hypothetical protein